MRPLSLTLERFGSFVERTTFTFPDGPGLYFMQGRNEAEPRLEANGTGKTTIWKALTWCLFGKDPRGLKAGDVVNWDTPKGASVAFEFRIGEGEATSWLEVMRTHAPNSWMLHDMMTGEPVDLVKEPGNPLLAMLKLEFEPWLNCVLMAQGEPMFLDLRPEAKASLFSEVMGLDRWVRFAGKAGDLERAADVDLRALERGIEGIEGHLRGLDAERLEEPLARWQRDRERRLAEVTEEYRIAISKTDGLKAQVAEAEADYESKRGLLADVVKWQEKAAYDLAERLAHTKRCDACGQLLVDEKVTELDREEKRMSLAKQRGREAVHSAERYLADVRSIFARNEQRLDALEDEADKINEEVNPYAQLRDNARREIARLRTELDEVRQSHTRTTERRTMLGFWVRGFKDLRLQQIAEALEELAVEVNSCVVALGLTEWELIFEVDRETKGGSISRGFTVYVRSPHNDKPVPWDAWSGGEAQRLRLATQQGLANLIRSSTGASIALEVWDEPTAGMSARGISDLLESLKRRARDEQRQIWVVDHRSLGYGGFDGTITVVKDAKGSRLVSGES